MLTRRFPYLHLAFILLLSIVFIPPAFAIEARYVKILIDTSIDNNVGFYGFRAHLFDTTGQQIDNVLGHVQLVSGSQSSFVPFMFGTQVSAFTLYPMSVFIDNSSYFYLCQYTFDCSVTIDLVHTIDIHEARIYTPEPFFVQSVYNMATDLLFGIEVFPVTGYRIMVSNDNLNWTLAAVVTDQPGTARTDTITLEDLGGGMDIDINYVVALFIAIILLGFFRQIFF